MKEYVELLNTVLTNGVIRKDRTGTGTISVFGTRSEYDLTKGFPAVTTKKLAWKACVSELLWFIEGSSDERRLAEILYGTRDDAKKTIWTENASSPYWKKARFNGDLGPVYGVQWRHWKKSNGDEVDQLVQLVDSLTNDPNSRRHILTAWNPGELDNMALPPCHMFSQFYVNDNKLSCQLYQRSADCPLGVPFNIASYSLFTHMLAQVCNMEVDKFIHIIGDAHIYLNQVDSIKEQLTRDTKPLPVLKLNPLVKDITKFTMQDITLENYNPHDSIKIPFSV